MSVKLKGYIFVATHQINGAWNLKYIDVKGCNLIRRTFLYLKIQKLIHKTAL